MTRMIRQQRKALLSAKKLSPRRPVFRWTGQKAYLRLIKHKRFSLIRQILSATDEYSELLLSIGFTEVKWAQIELTLDAWIMTIYHRVGGRGHTKEIPISLSNKLKFLRRSFNQAVALASFRERALAVLGSVKELSTTRHDLTHGIAMTTRLVNGVYRFSKVDYTPELHVVREFTLNPKRFRQFATSLMDLVDDTTRLAYELNAAFPLRSQ